MKKVKGIIGLFSLFLSLSNALAQQFSISGNPEQILALIKKQSEVTNSIQAEFKEEKHLSYLKEPQLSTGLFYYQKNDKMRWEQHKPFDYALLINGDKMIVRDNGVTKDISSSARVAGRMRNMLLDLVRGDFQSPGTFTTKVMENKDAYQIILIPNDKRMKNYYEEIQMIFSRKSLLLRELAFLEKKGNRTVTRFYNEKINQKISSDLFSAL